MCVAKNGDYFVGIILTEKLTGPNSGHFVLSPQRLALTLSMTATLVL